MKYLGLIVLMGILLAACGSPGGQAAVPTEATLPAGDSGVGGADSAPVIVFERTGGIAGVEERWEIFADGRIAGKDGQALTVPAASVSGALAAVDQAGFFNLADQYGKGSQCRDCFQYTIAVTRNGETKTVTTIDRAADAPAELGALVEQLSALVAIQ